MWQKKNQQYKGRNHNYSFINNLKKQKKITDEFEVMLSSLTLEEVIAVKLELSSRYINNRLYNFPIWSSLNNMIKEAVLIYALSACRSYSDSASFLGMNIREFKNLLKKYDLELDKK
tara:strand:+ start:1240 stop:1590 length:351 start_codon:yes stop_codon:yes gene_type:complete